MSERIDHMTEAMNAASSAVARKMQSTNAPATIARAAVDAYMDYPEQVEVTVTTADVEKLGHLLMQLSPATQVNSVATVRRLLHELNITEVAR